MIAKSTVTTIICSALIKPQRNWSKLIIKKDRKMLEPMTNLRTSFAVSDTTLICACCSAVTCWVTLPLKTNYLDSSFDTSISSS